MTKAGRRLGRRIAAVCGAGLLIATQASAQWTRPPGAGWIDVRVWHHATESRFDSQGDRVPLFAEDGRAVSTSVYLSGELGVVRGASVLLQWPAHRFVFEDVFGRRVSTGSGDPRIHLRLSPRAFGSEFGAVVLAVRGGVKLPAGSYSPDAEVIPLTEGQRDWELVAEAGYACWPRSCYVSASVGRRWRETNLEAGRKPGDEWFFDGSAGGSGRRWSWKLGAEVLLGGTPLLLGLPVPSARRRFVAVRPAIGRRSGPGWLSGGIRVPLAGHNLPAGLAGQVGYFLPLSRRE